MGAANSIIQKFGGQSALAKLLNKKQSTVQHWAKTGIIPAKWQATLIEIASRNGIDLTPGDFVVVKSNTTVSIESLYPRATHYGELHIDENTIMPCWVLSSGERVFSLTGIMKGLINIEKGGQLPDYIGAKAIKQFLPEDLIADERGNIPALIKFETGAEGFTKYGIGIPVDRFMEICGAFSTALSFSMNHEDFKLTEKQKLVAIKANMFLKACAKTGIIALVDEATGYQYDRAVDALQFKLKLFLEDELRKWEKTFPDQLWIEFGRLTNWKGPVHKRPKYWGKLVMELVYNYLDPDVTKWLKENAPKPVFGKNYHLWLSSQYGLKKLIEHLWMLVGMASACNTMEELRRKMAEKFGRIPIQLTLYLPQQPE